MSCQLEFKCVGHIIGDRSIVTDLYYLSLIITQFWRVTPHQKYLNIIVVSLVPLSRPCRSNNWNVWHIGHFSLIIGWEPAPDQPSLINSSTSDYANKNIPLIQIYLLTKYYEETVWFQH